ncbi:MAG: porin [Gemmatimonadota bacterium]
MRTWHAVLVATLCAVTPARARAQTPAVRAELTGRVQVQFNSTSADAEEASTTFETRRVRLGTRIEVEEWITGMLEADFALGRLQLKQVWAAFELDPLFVVRAGQFKKPFSRINVTSSAEHAMIERGVRIRGLDDALVGAGEPDVFDEVDGALIIGEAYSLLDVQGYAAYDLGATIEGSRGGLGWAAGIFNGAGPDTRDDNDGKSFAARISYDLDVGVPLSVGGAWSRRELTGVTTDGAGRGDAFEIDAELGGFRDGPWLLAEGALGDNLATGERFLGALAVLSYFAPTDGDRVEGLEPMVRLSWGDPDRTIEGDAGVLVTPGVNLYFFGRNRLMLNWDVYVPEGELDAQHAARAQVNLNF